MSIYKDGNNNNSTYPLYGPNTRIVNAPTSLTTGVIRLDPDCLVQVYRHRGVGNAGNAACLVGVQFLKETENRPNYNAAFTQVPVQEDVFTFGTPVESITPGQTDIGYLHFQKGSTDQLAVVMFRG